LVPRRPDLPLTFFIFSVLMAYGASEKQTFYP